MTHAELDTLFREVLRRGVYSIHYLLPRLRLALREAGFKVRLETLGDLMSLPEAALEPAAALLSHRAYAGTIDIARITRLVTRR